MKPIPTFISTTTLISTIPSQCRSTSVICPYNVPRMTAAPRDESSSIPFSSPSDQSNDSKNINSLQNTNTSDIQAEIVSDNPVKELLNQSESKDEEDQQQEKEQTQQSNSDSVPKEEKQQIETTSNQSKSETNKNKNAIKLTPEQIEKAKSTRAAATKAAEAKQREREKNTKDILQKAEAVLQKVGTKARFFELGEKARAKAEDVVETTISTGTNEKATSQEKLKGSVTSTAKSLVAKLTETWQKTLAPKLRDTLPDGFGDLSDKTLASATVGLFFAIVLFPTIFSGGSPSKELKKQQKINEETAASLEKRLAKDKKVSSVYGKKGSVFPQDDLDDLPPPKSTRKQLQTYEPKPLSPPSNVTPPQVAEAPKPIAPTETPQPKPSTPPVTTTPKVETIKPINPADVTSTMVMTAVTKTLGPNASLVSSASFDTLAVEPTIILEVTRGYHQLPVIEQKKLAKQILDSSRKLGYESVSIVEKDTGFEVAHAGVDIDLEDEAANLKAEISALRKTSDKLAIDNANEKVELGKLQERIDEERNEFGKKQMDLEKTIKNLREENSALSTDLNDAKEDLAKLPDVLMLEERTIEAEKKAEKMADSVEVLSIQLSKARSDEAKAKKAEVDSIENMNTAIKEKESALASVTSQIDKAKAEAQRESSDAINANNQETKLLVEEAEKKAKLSEEKRIDSEKQAAAKLESISKNYEKQLADNKADKEKEVQTIQSKYEAMLDEVQRKAKAELDAFQQEADKRMSAALKEAKATADALTKERDQAMKTTEKSNVNAEKAAAKANREKDNLQSKINRLEERLKEVEAKAREKKATDNSEPMLVQPAGTSEKGVGIGSPN